jgi:hypothetical protein
LQQGKFFLQGSTTGGQAKFVNSMRLDDNKSLTIAVLKPGSASKTEKQLQQQIK